MERKTSRIVVITSVTIAAIGLILFVTLPSNLNTDNTWGLYVAEFFLFEAMCAGSLFIAAVDRKHDRSDLVVLGLVCGLGAALAISLDTGSPQNLWRLWLTPNLLSPMFLDVIFLSLALILGVIFLVLTWQKREKSVKVVSVLLAIVAVCLPVGTSWLCTTLTGRVGWSSSFEVVIFVSQALVAGFLAETIVSKGKYGTFQAGLSLFIILALMFCEIGLAIYTTGTDGLPLLEIMSGAYAPAFWIQIVIGFVLPAILLLKRKNPVIAAYIALGGIMMHKYLYMIQGNLYPRMAMGDFTMGTSYFPSLAEWGFGIAVVALVVLGYHVLSSHINDIRRAVGRSSSRKTTENAPVV